MRGKLTQRHSKQNGSKRKIISKKFDINSSFLCALCASVVLLSNCKDEPPKTQTNSISQGKGLFVANEGTFGMGNASLTYINLENDTLNSEEDLFKTNNNRPLGDVFQSMSLINKNAWLVVNNSGKIEVINPETSKSVATIKNLKSPRYALEVQPGKVYVSDLYANAISILDANSFTKTGEIKCKGWTEEMILFQDKVWITNHNSDYLYIINPSTDIITDSIALAYGGSSLVSDKDGKVWVLCSGDLLKKRTGGLFCINGTTLKIEKQWLFTKDDFNPVKLKQNPANDSLYFINQGVFGFPKTAGTIPTNPIIAQTSGSSFYGLTIQLSTGNLFISDAGDFVSRGKVLIYSPKGIFIKSYKTGVVPGEFLWW
jgi:DNA-binding beta-propeller fold protein YncE